MITYLRDGVFLGNQPHSSKEGEGPQHDQIFFGPILTPTSLDLERPNLAWCGLWSWCMVVGLVAIVTAGGSRVGIVSGNLDRYDWGTSVILIGVNFHPVHGSGLDHF